MARFRGGGGSSGSGISCGEDAFATDYSRVLIAFHALFFIVFLVLAYLQSKRRKQRGLSLAKSGPFSVSIFVYTIVVLLTIISICLQECGSPSSSSVIGLSATEDWLSLLSKYILIAIIMVPVCKHIHGASGYASRMVRTWNLVSLVLLGVLLICTLGVNTAVAAGPYRMDYDYLAVHNIRLRTAYYAFEVFCILLASYHILVGAMSRQSQVVTGSVKAWAPLLVISALGLTLVDLAGQAYTAYNAFYDQDTLRNSYLAQFFLQYFFYSVAFVSALYILTSEEPLSADQPAMPIEHPQTAQYDNVSVPQGYPAQPYQQQSWTPQPYQQQPYQQPTYQPQP